ncbi:MAG: HD domain-containing protein [Lachnospiraceae bacterium]|nr:HD domain-containing protein [Lachnospiraceae bacterium]
MLFVKTEDLKEGMRLGKPIYNKKGVLLYDMDSKLTSKGIDSIRNFGLMGIYMLEPAEPCPPMTEEDIEFERFQTVAVFTIEEELNNMIKNGRTKNLYSFADQIISKYGRLDHKINFVQNLRSSDDYVYKHSLNVAILCAMMAYKMGFRNEVQIECIMSALCHEIGKLTIPEDVLKDADDPEEVMNRYELSGYKIIEDVLMSSPGVKRNASQAHIIEDSVMHNKPLGNMKIVLGSRVLAVADTFDKLTAMNLSKEPLTLLGALKFIQKHDDKFDKEAIKALIESINFLPEGCSVELTNGEKGLVIAANDYDIFRPVILTYSDNKLIDLRNSGIIDGLGVLDTVKKFDKRHVIDPDTVQQFKNNIK